MYVDLAELLTEYEATREWNRWMPVHVPCHVTQFKFKETISVLPFIFFFLSFIPWPFRFSSCTLHGAQHTYRLPTHKQAYAAKERCGFPRALAVILFSFLLFFFPYWERSMGVYSLFYVVLRRKNRFFATEGANATECRTSQFIKNYCTPDET